VQAQVATIDLARAVLTDPAEAGPSDRVEETTIDPAVAVVIWTAKLRTAPEVDKVANSSKPFSAAVVIASVAAEDLAGEDLADLAAEAAVDSAVAGSGADDDN